MRMILALSLIAYALQAQAAEVLPELEDPLNKVEPALATLLGELLKSHQATTGQTLILGVYDLPENQSPDEALADSFERLFGDPQDPMFSQSELSRAALIALYPQEKTARIKIAFGLDPWLNPQVTEKILDDQINPALKRSLAAGLTTALLLVLEKLESPVLTTIEDKNRMDELKTYQEQLSEESGRGYASLFFLLFFMSVLLTLGLYCSSRKELHYDDSGVTALNGVAQSWRELQSRMGYLWAKKRKRSLTFDDYLNADGVQCRGASGDW